MYMCADCLASVKQLVWFVKKMQTAYMSYAHMYFPTVYQVWNSWFCKILYDDKYVMLTKMIKLALIVVKYNNFEYNVCFASCETLRNNDTNNKKQ